MRYYGKDKKRTPVRSMLWYNPGNVKSKEKKKDKKTP